MPRINLSKEFIEFVSISIFYDSIDWIYMDCVSKLIVIVNTKLTYGAIQVKLSIWIYWLSHQHIWHHFFIWFAVKTQVPCHSSMLMIWQFCYPSNWFVNGNNKSHIERWRGKKLLIRQKFITLEHSSNIPYDMAHLLIYCLFIYFALLFAPVLVEQTFVYAWFYEHLIEPEHHILFVIASTPYSMCAVRTTIKYRK